MQYSVTLQSIAWIQARRIDETLEISPKFQRRPVWLDRERSSLMNTICSGLPFPEIYIHHETNPDTGIERHIVVDGQQRITSILKFIDGDVSLPNSEDWHGAGFRDMTAEQKTAFWDYKVVVRGLSQTNEAEIRNLFEILNTNNVSLNDQEIRNAHYVGAFKQLAERMADNPLFQAVGLYTARDIRRMVDVEYASELLLLSIEGITNKKDLLDAAYARFEEELPQEAELESEFNAAITLLRSLIREDNKGQAKKKSNFYTLYGSCLRYFRVTQRLTFRRPDDVADAITKLLSVNSLEDAQNLSEPYRRYFDSVTRAASDKGRRVEREEIMFEAIRMADEGITLPRWIATVALEVEEAITED
ncbi:MAG TPA: DUF262 domain-containing protein [Acidobacteriaceae bacterium]|jgi:hypothetical protein|nr:DUF262 domain-containing protein [Acidobacteriaceae bacterium]